MNKAVMWYRKAAEQGHVKAQYNLGHCYYNGKGITQDNEEAVRWYRESANQDFLLAQLCLGDCYRNGEGISRNLKEAARWYRKAAEQGSEDAKTALKELESEDVNNP